MSDERRKYKRLDKHYVLTYFRNDKPDQKFELTQLRNISKGGLCFITTQAFEPKAELGIELKTPFLSETTYLEGEVLQSHEKANGMLFETRLQFKFLNPQAVLLLNKLVEFLNEE